MLARPSRTRVSMGMNRPFWDEIGYYFQPAGSARSKKTGAQSDRQKEGISINKGLFVLGQVVSALSAKGQHQQLRRSANIAVQY
mmetsp:Transcript_29010/g.53081  ORF Transcript_29010/g.53081 Transcript_29010/m.53081 type:complete len:84 (+) Transcript_29010:57-308(+)